MGQSPSTLAELVFKPPNPATYDENLEGLIWITNPEKENGEKKIPAVLYQWKNRQKGEGYAVNCGDDAKVTGKPYVGPTTL